MLLLSILEQTMLLQIFAINLLRFSHSYHLLGNVFATAFVDLLVIVDAYFVADFHP